MSVAELCAYWPSFTIIKTMRSVSHIILTSREIKTIIGTVIEKRPCNFLVFGLGNDSVFWSRLNRGGTTYFIEDNRDWFQRVKERNHRIHACVVQYKTLLTQWEELLESPDIFDLDLPEEVTQVQWDVVLVDAPEGWKNSHPGRMKSIALSSRLVDLSGDVFVHDCDREVEKRYCDRFLKEENLVECIEKLRHYHITNRCA